MYCRYFVFSLEQSAHFSFEAIRKSEVLIQMETVGTSKGSLWTMVAVDSESCSPGVSMKCRIRVREETTPW